MQRTAPINENRVRGERGSITLETAMVMPVFLLFAFFLIFLVQTAMTAIALQSALTQTVRLAASNWYPLALLQDNGTQGGEVRETIGEFAELLPPPLSEWAQAIAGGEWSPESEAAKAVFGQIALQLADPGKIHADRFRLTKVALPRPGVAEEAFLTLEAEYRLPFRVPFGGRPLRIRSVVRERVWIGGSPSNARDAEDHALDVSFVSLEPDPARPGRKATLTLRAKPGMVLDLSILYKSGQSQAKHLGTAVAGESGTVSWTWLVSGNTTSGEWSWTVRGDGGSYTRSFRVERKSD